MAMGERRLILRVNRITVFSKFKEYKAFQTKVKNINADFTMILYQKKDWNNGVRITPINTEYFI